MAEKARLEADARASAEAQQIALASAAPTTPAADTATVSGGGATATTTTASCGHGPAAPAPAGSAGSGQSEPAQLAAEWQAAQQAVQLDDSLSKTHGTDAARQVKLLVAQVTRVHSVVWERADSVGQILGRLRNDQETLQAVCAVIAKKVISLGEMMVDKQPGMAYALAGFVLHMGEGTPLVWEVLRRQMQAACCYCVPHYVKRPPSGDNDEHMSLLGYRKRGDGKTWESKTDFYARSAGYVTLYAALLSQSWIAHFRPPDETMHRQPVHNPLGVATAWAWLARVVNQAPRPITATILLAFLKPSAHALHTAYPRQFTKLLRFLASTYSSKIHAKVDGPDKSPEEQAAIMTLDSWLSETIAALGRGSLPPPKEAVEMPEFKAPDDTRDANSRPGDDF